MTVKLVRTGIRGGWRGWRSWLLTLVTLGVAGCSAGAIWYLGYRSDPPITILQMPNESVPREGDFSANINGVMRRGVRALSYRINDGAWKRLSRESPRAPFPHFVLELPAAELQPGENVVTIDVVSRLRPPQAFDYFLTYAPRPVRLPLTVDWSHGSLDVQDGVWESIEVDGERRVRPRPGFEGYDRILTVAGPFAGGRRIETDVVFRHDILDRPDRIGPREFAFGVLSLWGGHPDDWSHLPRRGWAFSLGWWWSKQGGVGNEMSYRFGNSDPTWLNSYRNQELRPGVRYAMVIEVRDQRDHSGRHVAYHQRMKWWPADAPPGDRWIELSDREESQLPERDYAVALLALNCQVEFGPVRILPLAPEEIGSAPVQASAE